MSIKRYSGSGFAEVASRKRYTGTAWVNLTFGKRWNGSAWVDLWNDSGSGGGDSGGGSASSNGKGTFKNGSSTTFTSTVSRPPVNYSGSFTWTKSDSVLSVAVKFSAWISASATLGKEIKLTVFARLNGGAWKSAVIKSGAVVWKNSADKHDANISLSVEPKTSNTIEWYVTRAGSSYGGSAGNLGSAKSPIKQTFKVQ